MTTTQTPEYSGVPLLGILPELIRRKPYATFNRITSEYGGLVKVKVGPKPIYLVTDPEYVQQILRGNRTNYAKPALLYGGFRDALGAGLAVSDGETWERNRKMLFPVFHGDMLEKLVSVMVTAINENLPEWEQYVTSGKVIELYPQLRQITMNLITRTIFGSRITAEEQTHIAEDIPPIIKYVAVRGVVPGWVPLPGQGKMQFRIKRQQEIIDKFIHSYRDDPTEEYCLLNMMMQAVDEETNQGMTNKELFNEIMSLMVAGFEGGGVLLTWLFHILSSEPDVLDKLVEEVNTVIGSRTPTLQDYRKLTYCRQTVQEVIRYRAVVPVAVRQSVAADTFGDVTVPPNELFIIWFNGVHHNANVWDKPEVFDPDRFSPDNKNGRSEFAYSPSVCIGDEFTLMEGILALAMILQKYRIKVLPDQEIDAEMLLVINPAQPINVKIEHA